MLVVEEGVEEGEEDAVKNEDEVGTLMREVRTPMPMPILMM